VAEAPFHHDAAHQLTLVLEAWAARQRRPLRVFRNLAVRWLEEYPQTGIDPDVCVLAPPPPDIDDVNSLCLWRPGHLPPPLCVEIVSRNHPYKDYRDVQDRYAALGTHELAVFDPVLAGPSAFGGPVLLQLWRRESTGDFERIHFGDSPVYSEVLDAWLIPDPAERDLHIASDRRGTLRWPTEAEIARANAERAKADAERAKADAERAKADAERAKADAERAKADAERERREREDMERRLAELETKLSR
jgi:hypothetical protein